jgi:hypothetical protein
MKGLDVKILVMNGGVKATNHTIRRSMTFPAVACALIVALLVGGLPMLSGLVVAQDSRPAFTLDICHPIGSVTHTLSSSEAPLIPTLRIAERLQESGVAYDFVIRLSSRIGEAPNPPPPERRA